MNQLALPKGPIVAVIAVVIRNEKVLLVRLANPPDAGQWGFPSGKVERGENLLVAASRELNEEIGVDATALGVFNAVDAFHHDARSDMLDHYILVAALCRWTGGEPVAGDDAMEARWVYLQDLRDTDLCLSLDVARIAAKGAKSIADVPARQDER